MNAEIRTFLESLRNVVKFISELTPTEYDDVLVTWLNYLLGDAPLPMKFKSQVAIPWDKLPWEQILPLIMPILLDLLTKWLAKVGGGNVQLPSLPTTPNGLMFNSDPRCSQR